MEKQQLLIESRLPVNSAGIKVVSNDKVHKITRLGNNKQSLLKKLKCISYFNAEAKQTTVANLTLCKAEVKCMYMTSILFEFRIGYCVIL